jgi:glycosyltransferase involved in cell wall biosynthesis
MRIAFFTNNYLPNVYGVPMSIETFRQEFESLGHKVFIFAPNFPGYVDENKRACPTENFSQENFGRVFRYPSLDIDIKFRLPLGIPYSGKMDKILESLDIDIIHSHHPNLLGSAAMKWAKKKNIPLVFTWHTLYDQYTNFVPFLPAKFSANWIIKKAVKYANQADVVIVPTESVVPIIQKWGVRELDPSTYFGMTKKRIIPIATGVIESEFANANRNEVREKYGIKNDEIMLLLVSRLTAEKNINFLFEAIMEILKKAEQFNRVKFMLVGDGYLLPELKAKTKLAGLEDRVIFTGIVERKNLKNYYVAGDIFVCASKSETQGMIITEAMYMGLPIVAVKAPGINSLVENGRNGILVTEDKNEFILAVEKLIGDENLRKKMGEESAKIAREKYTSKICADKMLEVYKNAIRENDTTNKA